MQYKDLIQNRRSFRSLEKVEITEEVIQDLYQSVKLTPSCYNNQPWRFIFVFDTIMLDKMFQCLSEANGWAKEASMVVAVLSKTDLDCQIKDGRNYYHFDTGMAAFNLILKITDLGLVAHPIAGYQPEKVKKTLRIPNEYEVINLIIVGKKSNILNPNLKDYQIKTEQTRPERKKFDEIIFLNQFQ
ncbi:MAG: nitroreductase family protein [Spirochaetes bacterium]|nr:nitroreductase family protein [Spirochaetota bacterium]